MNKKITRLSRYNVSHPVDKKEEMCNALSGLIDIFVEIEHDQVHQWAYVQDSCYDFTFIKRGEFRSFFNLDRRLPRGVQEKYDINLWVKVPVIHNEKESRAVTLMELWMIPFWSHDREMWSKLWNVRAEDLFSWTTFMWVVKRARCILPVSTFMLPNNAQSFSHNDDNYLWVACVYEVREYKKKKDYSFSVITRKSKGNIKNISERMPLVLSPKDFDSWLSKDIQKEKEIKKMFKGISIGQLKNK